MNPRCRFRRNLKIILFCKSADLLIWSAATRRRFPTTRHVALFQSADMSTHSKSGHCRQFKPYDKPANLCKFGLCHPKNRASLNPNPRGGCRRLPTAAPAVLGAVTLFSASKMIRTTAVMRIIFEAENNVTAPKTAGAAVGNLRHPPRGFGFRLALFFG